MKTKSIHFRLKLWAILTLLPLACVMGQYVSISGFIGDEEGQAVQAANIYLINEYGSYSDEKGNFEFDIPVSLLTEGKSFSIIGAYLGFENDTFSTIYNGEQEFSISLNLESTSYILDPIVISDAPKVRYKNDAEFVFDFAFFEGGIAILAKHNNQYQVHFQNEDGQITSTIDIPIAANKIKQSCIGDLHVVGDLEGVQLHYYGLDWALVEKYDVDKFATNIEPCKYKTELGDFIFKHFRDFNQTIYYELFEANGNIKWSHLVYNQEQREYVNSEFRKVLASYRNSAMNPDENMINYGFTVDNVIDDGTWKGDLLDLVVSNNSHFAVSYFKDVVINPIYAPIFVQNGEIVILDHLNDQMFTYGLPHMQQNRTADIEYHKKGIFANEVIQDVGTEKIYAMVHSGRDLILQEINTFDGSIVRSHVLPTKFHFETSFKIKDGFLYFIAQPDINTPLKWVYRQRLF